MTAHEASTGSAVSPGSEPEKPSLPSTHSNLPPAPAAVGLRTLLGVFAAVVVADQLTKSWSVHALPPGKAIDLLLGVRLVHARNTGVAFSQGRGVAGIIIPIFAVIGLLVWTARSEFKQSGGPRKWAPTAYGLILGGALGNVLDRLFRGARWGKGAVVDMVDVGFWPIFNLADAALCVGVVLVIVSLLRTPNKPKPNPIGD
jgi:signal peptidase II